MTYLLYFSTRIAYEILVIFLFQMNGTVYNKVAITHPYIMNFIIYFDVVSGEESALPLVPITQGG